jgi:hypothetical protein
MLGWKMTLTCSCRPSTFPRGSPPRPSATWRSWSPWYRTAPSGMPASDPRSRIYAHASGVSPTYAWLDGRVEEIAQTIVKKLRVQPSPRIFWQYSQVPDKRPPIIGLARLTKGFLRDGLCEMGQSVAGMRRAFWATTSFVYRVLVCT